MAANYQEVASNIKLGIEDLIKERAKKLFNVDVAQGELLLTSQAGKGPEFDESWLFHVKVADPKTERGINLRVVVADTLGRIKGSESNISVENEGEIFGSTFRVAQAVNKILPKDRAIDSCVEETQSEVIEAIRKEQTRLRAEIVKFTAKTNTSTTMLEGVAEEIAANMRAVFEILAKDDPSRPAQERVAKLLPYMPYDKAGLALGSERDSLYSFRHSNAYFDADKKPFSSNILASGLAGQQQHPVLRDAFNTYVTDFLLQYTSARNSKTFHFNNAYNNVSEALRLAVEARNDIPKMDEETLALTINEAAKKTTFCMYQVTEQVLEKHATIEFKQRLDAKPIEQIIAAADLESIKLPPNISRVEFMTLARESAEEIRDKYLNEAATWLGHNPSDHRSVRTKLVQLDSRMFADHPPELVAHSEQIAPGAYLISARRDLPYREGLASLEYAAGANINAVSELVRRTESALENAVKAAYPELNKGTGIV